METIKMNELEKLKAEREKLIETNRKKRQQIINRNKKCDQWKTQITKNIWTINYLNRDIKRLGGE